MSERTGLNPAASKRILEELNNPKPRELKPGETGIPEIDAANKIEKLIYNDTLTNFGNRRGLNRYKNSLKTNQYPLTFVSFDLDNLKKINDNPDPILGGHTAGDKYILSFVKFTHQIFPDSKKFRLGGDEFTIPVLNPKPEDLNTIYQKLDEFNQTEDLLHPLQFTYATDIATSGNDFYDALKRSDDKLVEAKKIKKSQPSV